MSQECCEMLLVFRVPQRISSNWPWVQIVFYNQARIPGILVACMQTTSLEANNYLVYWSELEHCSKACEKLGHKTLCQNVFGTRLYSKKLVAIA